MKYFVHYLYHLFVDKVNAFRGSAADHLFAFLCSCFLFVWVSVSTY